MTGQRPQTLAGSLARTIAESPDIKSDHVRQCLLWMIRHTDGLSRSVTVSFRGPEAAEIARSISRMYHPDGPTRLDRFMASNNSCARFEQWHCENLAEIYFTNGERGKIWDRYAHVIEADYDAIAQTPIPGRFPQLAYGSMDPEI